MFTFDGTNFATSSISLKNGFQNLVENWNINRLLCTDLGDGIVRFYLPTTANPSNSDGNTQKLCVECTLDLTTGSLQTDYSKACLFNNTVLYRKNGVDYYMNRYKGGTNDLLYLRNMFKLV